MSVLTAVLLGLVQGIAEFLPISSSGHLAIAEHLLNMQGASNVPDFFDVLLHLGTLFAVFAAYWDDIRDMVVEFLPASGILPTTARRTPCRPHAASFCSSSWARCRFLSWCRFAVFSRPSVITCTSSAAR